MNPSGEPFNPRGRGRGPWRQGQDHKELRRPQTETKVGLISKCDDTASEQGAEKDISKTSNLSANAKEFYPKGYQSQHMEDGYSSCGQFDEVPQEEGDSHCNSNASNSTPQLTPEQIATNHLVEVMQHLTLNPGRFDVLITPLVDTFGLWLEDSETVCSIVNAIVEQSVKEPNFRYNGARLCHFLDGEFPVENSRFRSCLLTRCKEEHIRMPTYRLTDPRRVHGYVLFIAELFMQLEVVKGFGHRLAILGSALLEALSLLLAEEPTSESLKCVCQVLKLTGQPLNAQDPVKMTQIMQVLLHLSSSPTVEANIRHLINSVLQLKHQGWCDASNFMPHASSPQLYDSCLQNEPVFYGPDGQIMTAEESQFLQENVERIPDTEDYDEYGLDGDNVWEPDDEMDEEIEAAYEQFLQMGKNQSKNSRPTDHFNR